jgi:hypothetical protein
VNIKYNVPTGITLPKYTQDSIVLNEWLEKTAWIRKDNIGLFNKQLGLHVADALKNVIKDLQDKLESKYG